MRPILAAAAAAPLLFLSACASRGPAPSADAAAVQLPTQSAEFQAYTDTFITDLMAQNPGWAIYLGDYAQASRMTVPDAADRAAKQAFAEFHLAQLQRFDPAQLTAREQADHAIIQNALNQGVWQRNELRRWRWNPAQYNVAQGFALLLNGDYAPLDQRLRDVSQRLIYVPAYYRAAQANIEKPTREHTALAIAQNRGVFGVLGDGLEAQVAESGLSDEEKTTLRERAETARVATRGYITWLTGLQAQFDGSNTRSFRIGDALYEPLFGYQIQIDDSGRELYERALAERDRLHAQMGEIATTLWPQIFPNEQMPPNALVRIKRVIDRLSEQHVKRGEFVDAVRSQIRELEAFVSERGLVDLDPDKPLVVRPTPEYKRGVANASIDAPGPFDPGANTYYNVTPLDDYTPEEAESFLREYNKWVLQVLNIHEAVPGHYTQLIHSNRSPSLVKSILRNGTMIEGWAVYAERMMLEEGWGNDAPEMWLMYGKWNLRVVCNTILDYGVHVLGMTEDEAMDLLVNQAFQTETEARGKWKRATLSQVQLTSYFAGYSAIYDFREAQKQRLGEDFDLPAFHNQFLSYGSAPVRVIRSLMEGEQP